MIVSIQIAILVLSVLGLAVIARRVLGAPVAWWRCIGVGLLIIFGSDPVMTSVARAARLVNENDELVATGAALSAVAILVLAAIFVAGLALLVIAEVVIPTGTLPTPAAILRSWRARYRRSRRYTRIITRFTRHGLGPFLRRGFRRSAYGGDLTRVARALKNALQDCGPTFVKLGQMLSTRADLLPPEFITELSTLQDRVPPVPWPQVRTSIERSLGRPIEEVFAEVEETPLAAASVGQVHRARLANGQRVVLKVQRPGIVPAIETDLDILTHLAGRLERSTDWGRSLGARSLADSFAVTLREELDYRVELENTRAVRSGLRPGSRVVVPEVYPEYSSPRLLVMEEIDGTALSRAGEQIAALPPQSRTELASAVLDEVLHQVLVTGVFHSDLHAGNLMLCAPEAGQQPRVALLDFGSVGRLDDVSRAALGRLLQAIDGDDSHSASDAVITLLGRPINLDERMLEQQIGVLIVRFRGGAGTSGMFTELLALVMKHAFAVPPQVAAGFRALAALEGTLWLLSPDFNVIDGARESGRALVADRLTPGGVRAELEKQLLAVLPTLQRLPRQIGKVVEQAEQGRLTVGARMFADPDDRAFITQLFHHAVTAVLSAAAVLGGILMIVFDDGPMMTRTLGLYTFVGIVLVFIGVVLALRILVRVFLAAPSSPGGRRR